MAVLTHAQPRTSAEKTLRPFRLRYRSPDGYPVGKHIQLDPRATRKEKETDDDYRKRVETIYFPGDIVESTEDLAAHHPEKFERADAYADPSTNPLLTQMAPGELPEDFDRRMARLRAQQEGHVQGGSAPVQDHKQETDIPVNSVHQAAKSGAHRLSHLKLEQMSVRQLQEIIDSEEIATGDKPPTKAPDMAKLIRDWMATSR